MYLTDREKNDLLVTVAAKLAEERMKKGLKLNYPEVIAYITSQIYEQIRIGKKSVEELEDWGKQLLTEDDVMEGVSAMIDKIDIEATFPSGTHLLTLYNPLNPKGGIAKGTGKSSGGSSSSGSGGSTGGSSGGTNKGSSQTKGGSGSSSGTASSSGVSSTRKNPTSTGITIKMSGAKIKGSEISDEN